MLQVGGGAPVNGELLARMRDLIAHRGPDDAGSYVAPDGRVGLANRRLSIIDLSAGGHQPLTNEDGTVWIAFNGEIYNYRELRPALLARGHVFASQSDTEVIVHLYEEYSGFSPRRSRARNNSWRRASQIANANMPRRCCTQSAPYSSYKCTITSVSLCDANTCPRASSAGRNSR